MNRMRDQRKMRYRGKEVRYLEGERERERGKMGVQRGRVRHRGREE